MQNPSFNPAFIASSTFVLKTGTLTSQASKCRAQHVQFAKPTPIRANLGGQGKKPSRNRKFRAGKGAPAQKPKPILEPETVFLETGPSPVELVIPTLSILTVIGIIPFIAAVSRAAWVRYKFTNRRISISSGFQGKDQVEIIYRDIEMVKFIRRLGGAADCVFTLRDGAKLELRSVPEFEKIFDYIMEQVSEDAKEASGPA